MKSFCSYSSLTVVSLLKYTTCKQKHMEMCDKYMYVAFNIEDLHFVNSVIQVRMVDSLCVND